MKYIFAGVAIGLLTLAGGTLKVVASSEAGLHIECQTVASRQVKYCQGSRTSDIRDRGIVNLERKTVEIDLNIN